MSTLETVTPEESVAMDIAAAGERGGEANGESGREGRGIGKGDWGRMGRIEGEMRKGNWEGGKEG